MKITNHIRKIQEHANLVSKHVDAKDYPKANVDLDNIEANVRSVRDQIESIQSQADFCARPGVKKCTPCRKGLPYEH